MPRRSPFGPLSPFGRLSRFTPGADAADPVPEGTITADSNTVTADADDVTADGGTS